MNRNELADHQLCRFQDGDTAAAEDFVAATARELRAFIALYIQDPALVDDLAQETYIHVLQRVADYQPGTDPLAWLRTVAKHRVLAEWRRRQRRGAAHRRYVGEVMHRLGDASSAAQEAGEDPRLDALRHCLERLSQPARQLVEQHYFDGRSLTAVAELAQRSLAGLRVTLCRIRKSLHDCVSRQVDGAGS
jgi:RNA polymerase sigma-70 factor (ECF subfamily)